MKYTLMSGNSVWFKFVGNPRTGKFVRKFTRVPSDKLETNGFGALEPAWGLRRFYAIYPYNGNLIFQAGRQRWEVTEEVSARFAFVGSCRSVFELIFDGRPVHKTVLFHPLRSLVARVDPTFDGLDEEFQHFLLFVSRNLPSASWRKHVQALEVAA